MIEGWIEKPPLGVLVSALVALQSCQDLGIHDSTSLFAPAFKRSEIVGMIAGFGTTFAGLPDLLGMLRRRSSAA